jgi:hypothetical protein
MIQRRQTVYYFIAIIALIIPMLGFALVTFSVPQPGTTEPLWTQRITLFGNEHVVEQIEQANIQAINSYPLYLLSLIVIILLLVTIFSYKNLKRQAYLGKISLWATVTTIVLYLLFIFNFYQYTRVLRPFMDLGLVMHFTLAAGIFIVIGNRGVRKDQKLIASVDRIR